VGGRLGDDLEIGFGDLGGVGVLQEHAAGDLLDDRLWRAEFDFDEAEILLGGEDGQRFGGEAGRGDGFDEELGDGGGGGGVYFALMPMTPPKAETGSAARAFS
jgi:hypothetical protein